MKDRPALRVVAANPLRKRSGATTITCPRCETDIGIATSATVVVTQNPMRGKGKIFGGTRINACVHCLSRGIITQLF